MREETKKVRRGRDISDLRLTHSVPNAKTTLKKFSWICIRCGKEYIAKEDAILCYDLHSVDVEKIPMPYREDIIKLKDMLERHYRVSQVLLRSLPKKQTFSFSGLVLSS